MKITLATCRAWPDLLDSDLELRDALTRRGHIVQAAPWNGPIEAFTDADAVVLRACWDYSETPLAFLDWLESLEGLGKPIRNDPDIVRSNFDKSYLLNLADAGFRVPKTFVVDPHDRQSIEEVFDKTGWKEAVLKPVSGQSGFGVSKIEKAQPELWRGDAIVTGKALLQEFQADIGELGETTLAFFGGHFSHAVLRVTARDDWRANSQYGAQQELTSVSPEVVDQAKSALTVAAPSHVYARVDGIVRDSQLTIMEIELIEPTLYLHLAPEAADRFAEAVEKSLV